MSTASSDEVVEVSLTPEAVERAGIKTAAVKSFAEGEMLVMSLVASMPHPASPEPAHVEFWPRS